MHFRIPNIQHKQARKPLIGRYTRNAYSATRKGICEPLALCSSKQTRGRASSAVSPGRSTRVCCTSGNSTGNQRAIRAPVTRSKMEFSEPCRRSFGTVSYSCINVGQPTAPSSARIASAIRLVHLSTSASVLASIITRASGSVPEKRTTTLPLPANSRSAA